MQHKIKLAMVISNFSIGGAQKVVLDLLKNIDKTRFDVKLFVLDKGTENQFIEMLDRNNIQTEFVQLSNSVFKKYRCLSKNLKAFNPDVIHVHLDMFYAPLWSLLNRKTIVFTIHSQPHRVFNKKFLKVLFGLLFRKKSNMLVGVSEAISRETEALLNLREKSVYTVYNPIEIQMPIDGIAEKEIKLVNVARFHRVKNHMLLLYSFAKLLQKYSNAELSIAGDGDLMETCIDYAKELGILHKVNFLGNVCDIDQVLKKSHVFVLSSDSEAFPVSIMEAMSFGLPIVATAVGGVPELVKNNGILISKGDSNALCDAMYKMCIMHDFRINCGKKS